MKLIIFLLAFTLHVFALEAYKPGKDFAPYFNPLNCFVVLDKSFYINCYGYKLKDAKAVAYKVEASNLKEKQIKKRARFEDDANIPKKYRSIWSDYKNSGYTRGHIASNASFRLSKVAQASVFLMSNIIPQNAQVNATVWNEIEQRERSLAFKPQSVEVLDPILYGRNLKFIKNDIVIPSSYIKTVKTSRFEECYEIPNNNIQSGEINDYKISCNKF